MILCCGEALIDMLPAQTADGTAAMIPHSGGSVFNTAIALGRLSVDVGIFTGLSTDFLGRQLNADLRASNVNTAMAKHVDRPTPLAFVELMDGQAKYSFYDENSAVRTLAPQDVPVMGDSINALYFSGISLCNAPVADTMRDLCVAASATKPVMIDPNIRPGFVDDIDTYRARLTEMMAHASIIKVSDEDLDWIDHRDVALQGKAERLLAGGASIVVVTRGKDGASAYTTSGETVEVAAPQVAVVDTVGAGDSFNAGLMAKLFELGMMTRPALRDIRANDIKQALVFGAKVAAVNVSRAGANPPWLDEL